MEKKKKKKEIPSVLNYFQVTGYKQTHPNTLHFHLFISSLAPSPLWHIWMNPDKNRKLRFHVLVKSLP